MITATACKFVCKGYWLCGALLFTKIRDTTSGSPLYVEKVWIGWLVVLGLTAL